MNASATTSISPPTAFRNSRILTGIMFLVGIAALAMSPLMLIVAFTEVFPLHGFTFDRGVSVLSWVVGCFAFGTGGWSIVRVVIEMAHNRAHLDGNGVQLDLRTGRITRQVFIRWHQIVEIRRRTAPGNTIISLVTSDNRVVQYTGFTFYRPIKLARMISAASGQPIQKVK